MPPESNISQIPLPSTLVAEVRTIAATEHRAVADVLRDLVEGALADRRWKAHAEQELAHARQAGLPDDNLKLTEDYRQVLQQKIAQGVRSLREGRVTDGEAFMARMDAELAAIERQGR